MTGNSHEPSGGNERTQPRDSVGRTIEGGPEPRTDRDLWRVTEDFERKARDLRRRASSPDADGIHPAVERLIDKPWLRQALHGDHAAQLSYLVGNRMWDQLTRTLDRKGIQRVLPDEKVQDEERRIYVPTTDLTGRAYYKALAAETGRFAVELLPERITPEVVKALDSKPGMLSLGLRKAHKGFFPDFPQERGFFKEDVLSEYEGVPFVVPGGRFNEMYGWGSHFIALGLLADGKTELAKSIVENQVYQVEHYGKVLNANRSYYLTRSQPPFLAVTALAVYDRSEKLVSDRQWIGLALGAAIKEYHNVWNAPDHVTESTGLSRYFGRGKGMPIETEDGHFDAVILEALNTRTRPVDSHLGRKTSATFDELRKAAAAGKIPEMEEYFVHDRAMRESGSDTSYRFKGACANLNPVCLNSLLYRMESDIARAIHEIFDGTMEVPGLPPQKASEWAGRANRRAERMREHMWSAKDGMFHDVNHKTGEQAPYLNAAGMYPLWAGLASDREAEQIVSNVILPLEYKGGLVAGCPDALAERREKGGLGANGPLGQWDFPFGWAPHQILAWEGLERYGYQEQVDELAYRWIHMVVVDSLAHGGSIVEKYDVHNRGRETPSAEYGNVGKDDELYTGAGFGWSNAAIQLGIGKLSSTHRESLRRLTNPFDIGWDAAGPARRGVWH